MNNMANLGELVSTACRDYPDAIAIESASHTLPCTLTYTQLLDSATALTARLRQLGAGAHEPVHVRVSNQAQDFVAFLGAWLAGCVVVPVHRSSPALVTDRILAKSCARFVVDMASMASMGAVASGIDNAVADIGTGAPAPRAQLEGAALIIFTSGSTGAPKGVVVTHRAFAGKLFSIDAMIHFRQFERTLLLLNITFSFGIWVALLTLLGGGTVVLPEKFDPALLLAQLRGERICRAGVVPTMLRAMLSLVPTDERNAGTLACPALRQILTGGEQLSEQLAGQVERLFPNADLINIFGLTETSTCDFFQFPNYRRARPLSLGLPSSHVDYRVVDETQMPVSAGEIGELQIRSPYLMRGYLDEPELTAAAFAGAWFRTGDLAVQNADGDVRLMGRHKELIVRGGNKVTPMEIEQATMMFDGVGAAMAVGAPDPILGERIHVLIVPFAGNAIDLAALRTFLCGRLEKYKVPDFFYVGDALPTGRTGKADRRELLTLIASGALAPLTT